MASQSEQEGVEAMLGLRLVSGSGQAEDAEEGEEDESSVGILCKADPSEIVCALNPIHGSCRSR